MQNVPIAVITLGMLKPPSAAGRQDGEGNGGGGVAAAEDDDVMEPILNRPFALSSLLHSRSSAVANLMRSASSNGSRFLITIGFWRFGWNCGGRSVSRSGNCG